MTLQELRYLIALADTGHFGRAAEACFVSQSTLSTGLKKLEEQLGVTLFDRSLNPIAPTPIGAAVVESARMIVQETRRIRELAEATRDPMSRKLNLGVIPTLGPYYLPHALNTVRDAWPKLQLLLREEMTQQLLTHLAEGRLDAALLALPVEDAGLEIAPLFEEPFLAAVPKDHPLATRKEIDIDELIAAGLLLLEEGHCLRAQALEACRLEGIQSEEIRATSLETLRQMVRMGLGVTLIPALAAATSAGDGVELRPIRGAKAARTIGLVWRRRSPATLTMERLAETLKQSLPPQTVAVKQKTTRKKP